MAKKPKQGKRQTRISLAPVDRPTLQPNLALDQNSRAASVRFDANARTPKPRIAKSTSQRPRRGKTPQGTLELAFARGESRDAAQLYSFGLPTPLKSSQLPDPKADAMADSSDDSLPAVGRSAARRKKAGVTNNCTAIFQPSGSSPAGPVRMSPSVRQTRERAANSMFKSSPPQKPSMPELPSESEDEVILVESSKRRSTPKAKPARKSRRHARSEEAESEEDDIRSSTRKRPRNQPRVTTRSQAAGTSPQATKDSPQDTRPADDLRAFALASDLLEDESESDEVVPQSRRRRRAETDDESPASSPKRSTRRSRAEMDDDSRASSPKRPKLREREEEDLAEDLDFLRRSPSPRKGAAPQKLSAKEERRLRLEEMKASRELKALGPREAADSESEEAPDSASDEEPDDEETESVKEALFRDHVQRASENLDDDLDDFIVEQDDGSVVEDMSELPIEFSAHASKTLREHFQVVVEWMVHKKLNPGFPWDDEMYRLAFNKVNDEVSGYAGSKFISSAWQAEFSRAVKARPVFNQVAMPYALFDHHCEACNRSGHPVSFAVTLTGKAYDPKTLEPLKDDDGGDDSSASDGDADDAESVDLNGSRLPPESREFLLGSICKANAEKAHALLHWKWHLNSWVLDWLENAGYESAEQVVERHRWSASKLNRHANRVVDDLNAKELKTLWRDFKLNLEAAKEAKTTR